MTDPNKEFFAADPDFYDVALGMIPAGKMANPEDLAGTLIYLASGASNYVHGTIIPVSYTHLTVAASLGSLKGPKHGGANIKVVQMVEDMKKNLSDWTSESEVKDYLTKLLNKQAFDKAGLIYGMGHAVYSLSDPRADIFKSFVQNLSEEKGLSKEFQLYSLVERLAPEVIAKERKIYKGVSANVDFYSGFVYSMLKLPTELFTPIFAIARIAGWSAHRIEELSNAGKIIRPAYKNVQEERPYIPLDQRG